MNNYVRNALKMHSIYKYIFSAFQCFLAQYLQKVKNKCKTNLYGTNFKNQWKKALKSFETISEKC